MSNVVKERCKDCPHTLCQPSLSPSGFKCARKTVDEYFGSTKAYKWMNYEPEQSPSIQEPRTIHSFIGSVPEQSPARAPGPVRPSMLDAIEEFYRQFPNTPAWQKKVVSEATSKRNAEPISWNVQNRLNMLAGQFPHIARAWTAFHTGDVITINDTVIKRWMTSVLLVNTAVEEAGRTKVDKLHSIYGMLHNAAKELLDVFPEALAKGDVASLRDVVDELDVMVHDVEQLLAVSAPNEEDEGQ